MGASCLPPPPRPPQLQPPGERRGDEFAVLSRRGAGRHPAACGEEAGERRPSKPGVFLPAPVIQRDDFFSGRAGVPSHPPQSLFPRGPGSPGARGVPRRGRAGWGLRKPRPHPPAALPRSRRAPGGARGLPRWPLPAAGFGPEGTREFRPRWRGREPWPRGLRGCPVPAGGSSLPAGCRRGNNGEGKKEEEKEMKTKRGKEKETKRGKEKETKEEEKNNRRKTKKEKKREENKNKNKIKKEKKERNR